MVNITRIYFIIFKKQRLYLLSEKCNNNSYILLLHFAGHAQNGTNIFFFRNDALFPLSSRTTRYPILRDEKKVYKPPPNSFYIYDQKANSGVYSLKLPWLIWPYKTAKFTPATTTGNIIFVEVGVHWWRPARKEVFRTISLQDFEKIYRSKKWLRKKLAKEGYKSVDDLVKTIKVNDNSQ